MYVWKVPCWSVCWGLERSTGDVTDPDLKLLHIKHAKEIKDYILKQSEQERMKRRTVNMQHLDGNPGMSQMAEKDSCR